jgi:signal transduction histidine kinase
MLAATLVVAALALGVVSAISPRPGIFVTETADGPLVAHVGVGSHNWLGKIRPGMIGWWAERSEGSHDAISLEVAGFETGVPLISKPAEPAGTVTGFALATVAAVLLLLRLPGSAALAAIACGVALVPLEFQVGLPRALPLLAIPPLAAFMLVRRGMKRPRWFDLASVAVIGGLLAVGVGLASGALNFGSNAVTWQLWWWMPTMVGVGLAAAGGLVAFAVRYRSLPAGTPGRLVAAAVPLASHSRLEGAEEERSRLAVELHNSVLPRVQSSVEALRSEGAVDAASELETLATDLRGAMERRQTVTLEIGGLAEALRSEFESRPGPRVDFFVRGGSNRSPRRVELAAYRVGQAAIDNALRHSGADHVHVSIASARDMCELSVADDGVGLDDLAEDEARRRGRIGLAQMRLRAESVGATLDISGAPGAGTTVRFHWAE